MGKLDKVAPNTFIGAALVFFGMVMLVLDPSMLLRFIGGVLAAVGGVLLGREA
jgi:drug/metabolite transporter (DMT)-like permease